jgi:polyvinyl alcohol dehydrogenase (cytochrome)
MRVAQSYRYFKLGTAVAGLLGCLAPAKATTTTTTVDWPQPGMNAAHTGYNASETTISAANVATLKQKWSFTTQGEIFAQPILIAKRLYVLSTDGNLYALNATTGKMEWSYTVDSNGAPGNWGMVADSLHVYTNCQIDYDDTLGGGHAGLCALKAGTGALDWSYAIYNEGPNDPVDSSPYGPPTLVGSTLYFGESDTGSFAHVGYFLGIDKKTGLDISGLGNCGDSRFNDCNFVSPAPAAAAAGQVIYGTGEANGPPISTAICSEPYSLANSQWCHYEYDAALAPTIAGGKTLFVENEQAGGSTIVALDNTTGAVAWSDPETQAGQYHMAPAVANGIAYVLEGNGSGSSIYAVSVATGKVKWQYSWTGSAGGINSGLTVANGVVYASCTGSAGSGSECAFDASTGAVLRSAGPPSPSRSTPIVANGYLYTVCGPNDVCALTVK